jgi:copper transport protein
MVRHLVAALALVSVALPLALSLAAPTAEAHARLVASTPGAGERVAEAPKELRLVFSEPLDAGYTTADVIGPTGRPVATGIGQPDPSDARTLVAPLPPLPDGVYTVRWRTLSAADGHAEEGSFSFGVGEGGAIGAGGGAVGAAGGAGGDQAEAHGGSGEVQATFLLDLGVLLAFGLMVIAWTVLEPFGGSIPRPVVIGAGLALLAVAAGAALSILIAAAGVSADPVQYAIRTRPGLLLLGRAAIGLAGGLVVLGLAFVRRTATAGDVAMFGGSAALALTALSGHAAAFGSPAPILADAVHLGAAGTWLAGLVVLAALATVRRADAPSLRAIVPRFSALALVSVALIVLTGTYAAWLETRDFTALDDPYVRTLAVKVAVALVAFAVGAANFATDPAGRRFGGLGRRVGVEAGLAIVVVVVTASLTNGAPASGGRPVPLAEAPAAVGQASFEFGPTLAISPGRAGPNRFVVEVEGVRSDGGGSGGDVAGVRLTLDRLDAPAAPVDQSLAPSVDGTWSADVGALPADSRWDAAVVASGSGGQQLARSRFVFGLGSDGLTEGRAEPPVDPAIAAALLLLGLGLLATVFAVAGGRLPRVEPRTGRLALLLGGPLGAALGVAMLLLGPGV